MHFFSVEKSGEVWYNNCNIFKKRGERMKKKLTIGILAHVDAGKTTLSEALLYLSGKIRTLGRVDHKNT